MNAHPHKAGPRGVVHNGIIENFPGARAELAEAGYAPESQTDTETVALLVHQAMDGGATRWSRASASAAARRLCALLPL